MTRHFNTYKAPLLGVTASALLLTVIQPPYHWSVLAWIAWVPLIWACCMSPAGKPVLVTTYGISVVYWLINVYWIAPITLPGWLGLCLYLGLLWPVAALAMRQAWHKNIPLALSCAIVLTGIEVLQGFPLGGFYWRFLAHSQYHQIRLIQIADVVGATGVSFLIAMTNGLIAEGILAIRSRHRCIRRVAVGLLFTGSAIIGTLFYGTQRLETYDQEHHSGPRVAAVQSNVPQSVKESLQQATDMFNDLTALSQSAAGHGPDLIAWPETMVQCVMDPNLQGFLTTQETWEVFDASLRDHAKGTTNLLIGAYGANLTQDRFGAMALEQSNSAFLYRKDGTQDPNRYDKIHLILFGEYLPFKHSWPWLNRQLIRLTPYPYDYSLTPGTEYTVFRISSSQDNNSTSSRGHSVEQRTDFRFSVLICYEDTVADLARRFVLDKDGQKRVDWLVNVSNDGWFVRFYKNGVKPTSELTQHLASCVFRAVENRVGILRSVNTGISCLIDPCGRLRHGFRQAAEDFPRKVESRQGLAGWFVDEMPIHTTVTLFSRYGPWLDRGCATGLGLLLLWGLVERLKARYSTCLQKPRRRQAKRKRATP